MRNFILSSMILCWSLCVHAQAVTTWSVGEVTVDCPMAQACYSIMVASSISNTHLSQTTLRFFYDPTLLNGLSVNPDIADIENGYGVTIEANTSPTVGDEFGFETDVAKFLRISVAPNTANYLEIMNAVPTHVFDLCFDIIPEPIPIQLCAALVFDADHTAAPGIANDAGYLVGDAGLATQYVVNAQGSVVAADDAAVQFLWAGDAGFMAPLDVPGETVGNVSVTGCILTDCSPLSVGLLSFLAYKRDDTALLEWSTSYEEGNSHYEVERSTTLSDFVQIGVVEGSGNSTGFLNYTFIDESPLKGVNYYRLKQVDLTGTITISQIRSVVFDNDPDTKVTIAPNPVSDMLLFRIDGSTEDEVAYEIRISSVSGQLVHEIQIQGKGQVVNSVDVSDLASGMYVIEVRGSDGLKYTEKLIKQD